MLHDLVEDDEDGGRREIADAAESFPGDFEVVAGEAEGFLGGFEDFRAARMHDPGADVIAREVVFGEKVVNVAAEVFNDDFGDVRGEDDVEAFFGDGPTHDFFGVGVENAVGGEDAGASDGEVVARCFVSCDQDSGCAVTEEADGDEVGDGLVVALPGKGAELNGEQDGDLIGVRADVVGGTREARGTGDAPEAKDGVAADVRGEGHTIDEARIDGGAGDAGDGDEEDGSKLVGMKAGLFQGALDGALAQVKGSIDPDVIGFAEGVEGEVIGQRAREITAVDAGAEVETLNDGGEFGIGAPVRKKGVEKFALSDVVLGEGSGGGKDMHAALGIGMDSASMGLRLGYGGGS